MNETDLPPTPPEQIMDVRFADGKQMHPWTADQHRVLLSSVQDPVTLTVTGLGDARLSVDLEGRLIEVREGVPIRLRTRGNALVLRTHRSDEVLPERFALLPNYPNPFNPVTTFTFDLARPARTRLGIYDLLGREVRVLFNESMPAGRHSIPWDASGLPSGVYLCRLTAGENTATQRILLLK